MHDHPIPVFDLGGVFVDWNPMHLFRKLFDSEEEAQWFHDNVCTMRWNLELDAGLSYTEGVAALSARFPAYRREIRAFDIRWPEMLGPFDAGTIAIHDALIAQDIPTFAITNFSSEKFETVFEDWPFLTKFDGIVVSGAERLVKPDYRIFFRFLERYSLDPDQCIFIDDSLPNVVAAQKIGMQAVQFNGAEKLRDDLTAAGLPLEGLKLPKA